MKKLAMLVAMGLMLFFGYNAQEAMNLFSDTPVEMADTSDSGVNDAEAKSEVHHQDQAQSESKGQKDQSAD